MTFEQLESIQNDIHPLTKQRLVPERILKQALWQQVQLRSKIESASERDIQLNMTVQGIDKQKQRDIRNNNQESDQGEEEEEEENQNKDDDDDDGYNKSVEKYYPIPTDDTTTYTGESAITLASASTVNYGKKRLSSQQHQHSSSSSIISVEQYSIYPPFRFSVEFADVASLKHGMRVYSDTVFYAG